MPKPNPDTIIKGVGVLAGLTTIGTGFGVLPPNRNNDDENKRQREEAERKAKEEAERKAKEQEELTRKLREENELLRAENAKFKANSTKRIFNFFK
jgi:hypothetical protein